jgi:hypothetical protein
MKISAQTARKIIKANKANIVGKMSTQRWPDGDHFWIINDNAKMQTLHVKVADAPKLNLCKAN